ncbi:unnamed protein product [Parascedosporium putredinis]|uniref:Uncharacterized protein n=1 Tax=Parascedosporium putredinis TaxID=1442378 RepID=A0A9P1M8V0_9PEZI|nr:unnamed protein product [Parascedosporium putredinis]CAI7990748.1 unnamed protein product [Parascedosporium putredinis]
MPVYDRTVADTGSDLAVAKIQDWIQDCLGDHADETHCGPAEDPILPTRIIDVGLLDGIIRLEEGNGMEWHVFAEYYIARFWRTMVCSYMNLHITKSDDRLPAIGGLARHMAQRRKSRYLAGVWDNSINDDLLWVVRVPQKEPRPAPLMAPTWSWASVSSPISYWDEILVADPEQDFEKEEQLPSQHFTQISKCEVVPDGPDEYGRVKTSTIEARGLVVKGTLQREVQHRSGKATDLYHVAVTGIRVEMMADYSCAMLGMAMSRTVLKFCVFE